MATFPMRLTQVNLQSYEEDEVTKVRGTLYFYQYDTGEPQEPYDIDNVQDVAAEDSILPTGRGGDTFEWV